MSEIEIEKEFDSYIKAFGNMALIIDENSWMRNHPETPSFIARNVLGSYMFLEKVFGVQNIIY